MEGLQRRICALGVPGYLPDTRVWPKQIGFGIRALILEVPGDYRSMAKTKNRFGLGVYILEVPGNLPEYDQNQQVWSWGINYGAIGARTRV